MKINAILLACALTLSGCKVWVDSSVYVRDVQQVLETQQPTTTPMRLSFEIPSQSACTTSGERIAAALKKAYGDVAVLGCRQVGMDSIADFSVQAEVVHEIENKKADSKQPLYFGVDEVEEGIEVGYYVNTDTWAAMDEDLKDETQHYTRLEPVFKVTLQNDAPDTVAVTLRGVFLNGTPVPAHSPVTAQLKRREQIEIRLSDVQNSAMGLHGSWIPFALIGNASPD